MRVILLAVFLLIISWFQLSAQRTSILSKNAKLYLVTVAPGDELYSGFGHSAVRVLDKERGLDVVFNYGTFDFDTPNFYLKFMRGKLNYMLSAGNMEYLVRSAKANQRSVYQQLIALDSVDRQRIYGALVENIMPENRFYKYDFFYDNCATRIRDIFEDNLGKKLSWNSKAEELSFREFLDIYLKEKPWQNFGIDLVLGAPTDKIATVREEMFLPDYLMKHFGKAIYKQGDLVRDTQTIYEAPEKDEYAGLVLPEHLAWLICLLGVIFSVRNFKKGFNDRKFHRVIFVLTGIVGLVITFLWFFSDHIATANNWNYVWASPLNFLFAAVLFKKSHKSWHGTVYAIIGAFWFLLLGFLYTLPQMMHDAVLPIVLYFAFISFNYLYRAKKFNQ